MVQVVKHREVHQKADDRSGADLCYVGYTNARQVIAAQSFNGSAILAEDKLFATWIRLQGAVSCEWKPGTADTVGFVRNLPHRLVDAFKATLEEAVLANLLLHVVDVTNPEVEAHLKTTDTVLDELGAGDKIRLIVFNKVDSLWEPQVRADLALEYPDAFFVSAHSETG